MIDPEDAYRDLRRRGRGVRRPETSARRIEVLLTAGAAEVIRRLELRAWQALTSANPVDTGFSRSSWTPTIGSAIEGAKMRPTERGAAISAASTSLAATAAAAREIASSYTLPQGRVFITNPVPYIVFLNEGSSSQAPAKFVERAIDQAIRSVDGSA